MKKLKRSAVCFVILLMLLALFVSADSEYTTENDPLVSLSYVNNVLKPQIISEVLDEIKSLYPNSGAQTTYRLVTMKKGQSLTASGCVEVIMTYGSANAVVTASENLYAGVGLDDLTAAKRLRNGDMLLTDHYIVIPRGDGRGFTVTSDSAYFLVRGEYNIK